MSSPSSSDSLSLADFFKIIRSKLPLLALIIVLVVVTTALVLAFMPKWYRASASVRVEKPEAQVALGTVMPAALTADPVFIRDQFEILSSRRILSQVVDSLDLEVRLAEMRGAPFSRPEDVVNFLRGQMLSLSPRPSTSVIDIRVEAQEDPELAAEIANEIALVYQADRIEFAVSGQNEGIRLLKGQLGEQEATVGRARDVVEDLRVRYQITDDISLNGLQLEFENIRNLQNQLTSLRVDMIGRKSRWEQFAEIPMEEKLRLVNNELIADTNIATLLNSYLNLEQDFTNLREQLGDNHPNQIATAAELRKIRSQLEGQLAGYEKSLEIGFREAQARVRAMEEEIEAARVSQIDLASGDLRQFEEAVNKLRDEEAILRTMRNLLATRIADAEVPRRPTEILNTAVAPRDPSRPNWVLFLGIALVGGTALAFGTAFILELFDTSLRTVEDIERRVGYPILGVVPKKPVLVNKESFHSFDFEPYRVIQTNLALAKINRRTDLPEAQKRPDDKQVIAFVSSGPGEGKSTTLHNLAAVMALSGQRVLVVDTDLRRPTQHEIFQLARRPGLSEYFKGDATEEEIVQHSKIPNLDFVASGRSTHVTLSVLNSRHLQEVIEKLLPSYDKILLDSPPMIGVSDASVIVDKADGVVFVIQHRKNPASMTLRAKSILDNVAHWVYGAVLNQVPHSGDEDYNYYTTNYTHYGEVPSEPSDRTTKNGSGEMLESPAPSDAGRKA